MTITPIKILIVDDDSDDRDLIKELIQEELHSYIEISLASNYSEALEHVKNDSYDVCLFDYILGQENGIELLKECRDVGVLTPVIFLTGQGDEIVAVQSIKAGASDYLPKAGLSSAKLCGSIQHSIEGRDDLKEAVLSNWKASR